MSFRKELIIFILIFGKDCGREIAVFFLNHLLDGMDVEGGRALVFIEMLLFVIIHVEQDLLVA